MSRPTLNPGWVDFFVFFTCVKCKSVVFLFRQAEALTGKGRDNELTENVELTFYLRLLESRKFKNIVRKVKQWLTFMLYSKYSVGFGIAYP